jgi:hypothetical protein
MPVWRVTIVPVGAPDGTFIAGDFIADTPAAASHVAEIMVSHPIVAAMVTDGFTVVTEPSSTDPRFAVNYDGPAVYISNGGQC